MNRVLIGSNMLVKMDQEMQAIKKNMKETQHKHKIYAGGNRVFKKFQVWK